MNADEVRQMLGLDTGHGVYIGGSPYRNTIQYVINADKRLFQFYGESGHVYKMFVLFLDDSGVVFDARIVNVH